MDKDKVKFGVICCEKCYTIPEISILNKKKVQLKCQKCNDIKIQDFSYFDRFRKKYRKRKLD